MQMINKNELVELLNEMRETAKVIKKYSAYEVDPFTLTTTDSGKLTMKHNKYGQFDFDSFAEAVGILMGFQNVFIVHGHQIAEGIEEGVQPNFNEIYHA